MNIFDVRLNAQPLREVGRFGPQTLGLPLRLDDFLYLQLTFLSRSVIVV